MSAGSLPQTIPPQTARLGTVDDLGNVTIDITWYLLFYNLINQVLNPASGSIVGTDTDLLLVDATDTATVPDARQVLLDPQLQADAIGNDIAQSAQAIPATDSTDIDALVSDLASVQSAIQELRTLIAGAPDIVSGMNVTITTAPLTGLGATGSMTFVNGVLVAQTPAT